MGIFWSSPPCQDESIARQKLQQSTLKELTDMEKCIHCYTDSRLKLILDPYVKQKFPWDNYPYCYNPLHLRYSRNYHPKECCHCPKGQFQDHTTCKVLDRIYGKTTRRCQCVAPAPDIDLEQCTDDDSDLNENVCVNYPI